LPQAVRDPLFPGLSLPRSRRLANGARVVSLTLEDAPLVCLDFWSRAGSVWEEAEESGIAHFLEHMVFKGSHSLAAGEFDRRIEALGGSSNAATGFDDVHFHVLIPPEAAAEALELLLDLVLAPALRPEAFNTERRVVLEELAQSEDQPDEVAVQTLLSRACPSHNYGMPILGRRECLLAHTPQAMAGFHQRRYRARHCVLAMSGALELSELDAVLQRSPLAQLPEGVEDGPPPPLTVLGGSHRIELPRLESARLLMLWALPPARQQDAVMGADLLTSLLAEGRRSRLVERLREQLRIVESIDLDLHVMECGSLALLEAVCETEDLEAVRESIETEWRRLLAEPLPEPEWQRCRKLVSNGYSFGLESPGAVAALIGSNALWNRDQSLDHPLKLLERWSPSNLQQQAAPWLDPHRACLVMAVPA
jgi:zinc protease